jgi:hypothetical protein
VNLAKGMGTVEAVSDIRRGSIPAITKKKKKKKIQGHARKKK